jgi:hypothetical protein
MEHNQSQASANSRYYTEANSRYHNDTRSRDYDSKREEEDQDDEIPHSSRHRWQDCEQRVQNYKKNIPDIDSGRRPIILDEGSFHPIIEEKRNAAEKEMKRKGERAERKKARADQVANEILRKAKRNLYKRQHQAKTEFLAKMDEIENEQILLDTGFSVTADDAYYSAIKGYHGQNLELADHRYAPSDIEETECPYCKSTDDELYEERKKH